MKNIKISRIVFLVIALISVGLMAWAVVKGAAAPESSDIAKNMALVGQLNEAGDGIVLDEKGVPVPVKDTDEGIKATQATFTYQYRADDIYTGYLADLNNKTSNLDLYLSDLEAFDKDSVMNYQQAVARIAELEGAKASKDKKEREELVARVEAYNNTKKEAEKIQALVNPDQEADEVEKVLYFAAASKDQCEARIAALEAERDAKIAADGEAYAANKAKAEELTKAGEQKKLNNAEKKELTAAQEAVKAYDEAINKFNADIEAEQSNFDAWAENISTLEQTIAKNKADGEAIGELAQAISINIMWFYFLMLFSVVFVIIAWLLGMAQNPGGIWKTCVYLAVVALVVGGAYFVANSHGWGFVNDNGEEVGKVLHDITGEPLGLGSGEQRTLFEAWHYMTAEISILVTYIAIAGATLAAVFSWARGTFKS